MPHTYELISVDDHLIEPAHVWSARLPKKFQDDGPRVIERDGREYWTFEGRLSATMGLNAVAGKDPAAWSMDPVRYSDMIPGCYDPAARARDLMADGIAASLCFPSLPRFAGTLFLEFSDRELANLCVKAYNDFVLDEWCAAAPGLFIPAIIVQLWDPHAAAAEIRRCAALGARALSFPENPAALEPSGAMAHLNTSGHERNLPSFYREYWDPVWEAVTETDMAVCVHVGTSGLLPIPSADSDPVIGMALIPINAQMSLMEIIMSPVTEKFPTIKFVLSEGGISWIPGLLDRADEQLARHGHWSKRLGTKPSEIFRRNFYGCFVYDPVGVELRHRIGVDRILWECDYPHAESPWPNSQAVVDKQLGDLPVAEIEAMTGGNARRAFNW